MKHFWIALLLLATPALAEQFYIMSKMPLAQADQDRISGIMTTNTGMQVVFSNECIYAAPIINNANTNEEWCINTFFVSQVTNVPMDAARIAEIQGATSTNELRVGFMFDLSSLLSSNNFSQATNSTEGIP